MPTQPTQPTQATQATQPPQATHPSSTDMLIAACMHQAKKRKAVSAAGMPYAGYAVCGHTRTRKSHKRIVGPDEEATVPRSLLYAKHVTSPSWASGMSLGVVQGRENGASEGEGGLWLVNVKVTGGAMIGTCEGGRGGGAELARVVQWRWQLAACKLERQKLYPEVSSVVRRTASQLTHGCPRRQASSRCPPKRRK
jgi:hypothetical protein